MGKTAIRKYSSFRNCPASDIFFKSWLVAEMMRASTGWEQLSPTGRTFFSWITRSSLACSSSRSGPISSEKTSPCRFPQICAIQTCP